MKKVALSFLALILGGATAFADEASPAPSLKFSGYLNTGIEADFSSSSPSVYEYGRDDNFGAYGSSFKLVGTYDADAWGYKFRLRARPLDYSGNSYKGSQEPPAVNYVYGWFKPFDGATVFGGKIADGTLSGLDDQGDNPFFYLEGAEALYTNGGFSVAAAAGKRVPGNTTDGALSAFAAKYSLPKLFSVEAHLTTGYDPAGGPSGYSPVNAVGGYAFTASLDGIAGLTLTAGYNAYTVATAPYTFADLAIFYTVDKVTVGGKVYDHISSQYFSTAYYDITPSVAYALTTALTLGANVEIITDDESADSLWSGVQTPRGSTVVPAMTATYVLGGTKTTGSVGYDVTNKTTKSYLDFVFSF